MKCKYCSGLVEWQGSLLNPSHALCVRCGAENSQDVPQDDEEETATDTQQAQPAQPAKCVGCNHGENDWLAGKWVCLVDVCRRGAKVGVNNE